MQIASDGVQSQPISRVLEGMHMDLIMRSRLIEEICYHTDQRVGRELSCCSQQSLLTPRELRACM